MAYTKAQREVNELKKQSTTISDTKISSEEVSSNEVKRDLRYIPQSAYMIIRSNCFGQLTYISKKTSLEIVWDNYGNTQLLSLEELITMRNTQRKFFEKNWIMIEGFQDYEYRDCSVQEILEYLQVSQYFKDSLCPKNIDEIFNMSPDEIEKRVSNMSAGVKNSIMLRANELIINETLDSKKRIKALEKALGCTLEE